MESSGQKQSRGVLSFLRHPKIQRLYAIDVRALATIRIALGLLLLVDLTQRVPYLAAHYSDVGAMPLAAVHGFSIHALSGSPVFVGFLFLVAAVFAVMLILGYRTWVATVVSWVLLVSLHERNLLINNSGDHLLTLLLFWSLFLPLGARASVDAWASRSRVPRMVASPASLALLLQIVCVYVFSALLKSHPVWREEGTAIYYALQLDRYTTAFGRWLANVSAVHEPLTHATRYLELYGPFLAFIPIGFVFFRTLTVFAFIGFHIGLALSFNLIYFSHVCSIAWLAFLPAEFWDRLLGWKPLQRVGETWDALIGRVYRAIDTLARAAPRLSIWALDYKPWVLRNVLVGLALVYVFFLNVGSVYPQMRMVGYVSWIGRDLNLNQKWSMFSPFPSREDGWWVIPAKRKDGSEVDLFSGRSPIEWKKPVAVADTFSTPRWRRYLQNVWGGKHRAHIADYAAWLRHDWNRRHDEARQIESMEVYFMLEYTQPDPQPPIESKKRIYRWNGPGDEEIGRARPL